MRLIPSNLSLRGRFMALTGIVFFAMTILMVTSILYFVTTTERDAWRARQTEAASNAADKVAAYLRENERVLQWVDIYEHDEIQKTPALLDEILLDNPSFLEILFVDKKGNPTFSAARGQSILSNQFTILQSEWFQAANAGQTFYTRVQTSPQNQSYIILAMPSRHGSVVAAQIQMDSLWETVARIHFGETGRIYIVNLRGQVIAHPNKQIVLANKSIRETKLFQDILNSPRHQWTGRAVNFDGVEVVSVSVPIEATNWIVVSELPVTEAYAVSRRAYIIIPAGVLLISVLATLIIRDVMRSVFLKPLDLLHKGAREISGGNLSHRIPIVHMDEIGEVIASFNAMSAELEKQREELEQALAFEYASKHAAELARSNALIVALSKVTAAIGNKSSSDTVFDMLGSELGKLNLTCAVATIDLVQETATIRYVSYHSQTLQKIEKLTGLSITNYSIPKKRWPGTRILSERTPIWYPAPREIIQRMFPSFPDFIANQAWKLIGINAEGKICMLPLRVEDRLMGVMAIWGADLREEDSPVLEIFAGQVAGILQSAFTIEAETERANELARLNSMILALSNVASRLENSKEAQEIFETIGKELKRVGLDSMVGLLDESKQNLHIQYVSVHREVIRWAEKATGHSVEQLSIPRHLWPTDKVVTEKMPYWDPNRMRGTLNIFPILPESLQKRAFQMAGISLDDPVCYLPLANDQDVFGVLAVWGTSLKQSDVYALSIVANQVTTAIRNSQLFELEIKRSQEKEVLLKEIHHRVKNNLQIISSLLNLQANQVKDAAALRSLRDSHARVRSMALIHEKLYNSKDLAQIDFGEYVRSLATDLFRSYQRESGGIQLKINVESIRLDLDQAITCGLILNELMTNALKYAFPGGRSGTVWVELKSLPEQTVSLRVADDGAGLPDTANLEKSDSLGWQLIRSLSKQLNGQLRVDGSNGLSVEVMFQTKGNSDPAEVGKETRA